MAELIKASASLNVGGIFIGSKTFSATQAGDENIGATQSIATSSTQIALGNVSTIEWLYVENTDATNYVEVDSASTFDKFPQKITAGNFVLLRPQSVTLYAKANTQAVKIRVVATEL